MENLKMKRKKRTKNFDLPEPGFEPQILADTLTLFQQWGAGYTNRPLKIFRPSYGPAGRMHQVPSTRLEGRSTRTCRNQCGKGSKISYGIFTFIPTLTPEYFLKFLPSQNHGRKFSFLVMYSI